MPRHDETSPLLTPSDISYAPPSLPFPLGLVSPGVRPYLELIRFHKPTGTVLMFWPFAWGLTLAAYHVNLPFEEYWPQLGRYLLAAFLLRGSACTINDIFDREYDAGVERTKGRPLASGRISVFAASVYLILQYVAGVAIYVGLNEIAFYAAIIQLLPLFLVYPLMKRITYWPQAWLGICMNFGLAVTWIAVTGDINWPLLSVLLAGTWGWTMHYDTIYACQDREDDVKVGVKSTAVLLGDYVEPFTIVCSVLFIASLAVAGFINHQTVIYYVISVGGTALHIVWQYSNVNLEKPDSCWRFFVRNGHMGWLTWAGLMLDYVAKAKGHSFPIFR
ncbi:UbiA prenyltransferase [Auriscalpium vulgare]|uniref:UbiA prenyltransferase n=1 Tax=Auriscalpium vulgare TaxID=40419 RepID=A0ACB8RIS0_9AGAM|nr:UbiA prenyltransferase [Auriscalpium vulgare]